MSNISQKLTYLNGTKSLIKDGINALGGELTNQSTFRSYANVLNDLYEVFPKVESEETTSAITLSPTQKAKMKLTLKGNIEQDSTTQSKNLLNPFVNHNAGYTTTINGVTFTLNNDGTITANGTATATATLILFGSWSATTPYLKLDISKNYVLPSFGSNQIAYIRTYDNGTYTTYNTNTQRSILGKENVVYYGVEVPSGKTVDNYVFKVQLEEGNTPTEYVPFTPNSPSPSYPQDIHIVSGDNEIKVCNKNLFDGEMELGTINSSGELVTSNNYIRSKNFTPIIGDVELSLSSNLTGYTRHFIYFYDEEYNFISVLTRNISYSFTTPSNAKYLKFRPDLQSNDTNVKFQLEKGSTATDYVEHKEYTKEINLPVENINSEGIRDGLYQTSNGNYATSAGYVTLNDLLPLNYNEEITISTKLNLAGNFYLLEYDENKTYLNVNQTQRNVNYATFIVSNENTKYIAVDYIADRAQTADTIGGIQIEKGSKKNSFTPYGTTPIEVGSIGEYEDEFFKNTIDSEYYDSTLEQDKWYLKKRIGKKVLDGSETWTNMWDSTEHAYRTNIENILYPTSTGTVIEMFSNYFNSYSQNTLSHSSSYADFVNYGICIRANNSQIIIKNNDTTTVADFQTWLGEHNTTVYYVLATPENILLNDTLQETLDSFYSYQEQTNISQENNDLPFVIKARALKDFTTLE